MRKFLVLLVILLNATMLGWLAPYSHSAGWWGGGGDSDRIPYCTQGECTLQG